MFVIVPQRVWTFAPRPARRRLDLVGRGPVGPFVSVLGAGLAVKDWVDMLEGNLDRDGTVVADVDMVEMDRKGIVDFDATGARSMAVLLRRGRWT